MNRIEPDISTLDEAARAGWLYYVGQMTQDQIATELGVSRQRAQRLVAKAMAEGLVHVRLDHPIARCLALEAALARRYGLVHARVGPGLGPDADPSRATAGPAAELLERFLSDPTGKVFAFGTGRSLSSMVAALTPQVTERHRIVSLIGNIAPDGSASFYDVIQRLADKLHAPHFPMSVPLVSDTPEERALFHALGPVQAVVRLAQAAHVTFVGVGQMGDDAPLYKDGFLTRAQLAEMQSRGAAGEIVGGVFDSAGRYIETPLTGCIGGVQIDAGRTDPVIGVAAGPKKVAAIRAALVGRLLNGLVTDEQTAEALLA